MEIEGFFQFEMIINVIKVSPCRFIWIPMLLVYGHYKYVYPYSAGIALIFIYCGVGIAVAIHIPQWMKIKIPHGLWRVRVVKEQRHKENLVLILWNTLSSYFYSVNSTWTKDGARSLDRYFIVSTRRATSQCHLNAWRSHETLPRLDKKSDSRFSLNLTGGLTERHTL